MSKEPDNKKLIQEQERAVKEIKEYLQSAFVAILKSKQILDAIQNQDQNFSIAQHRLLRREIQKILKNTGNRINITLINSVSNVWEYSDENFWNTLQTDFPHDTKELFDELKELRDHAVNRQRSIAGSAREFLEKKRGGFTISERVWNITGGVTREIDIIVQNAVKSGASADDLSHFLRKYLNEPDRLYRKVLNKKTGKMEWSKAAQDYHPGRGVYRSSYKNAVRLARTEINRAYRYSEWLKMNNNPLVRGFEIRSSRQENTCEVCASLEGTYPKSFKWDGWHPQCLCFMIPVQLSRDEFVKRTKMKLQGKLNEYRPPANIERFPDNFIAYLEENKERIENARSLPYWYEDNFMN